MTKEEIQEAVRNHKCPGAYFCTVATTGYPEEKRIRICTECWNQPPTGQSPGVWRTAEL